MGVEVFENATIAFGQHDLSTQHNQVAISAGIDEKEKTAFGDTTHVYLPGRKTAGFSAEGYWEAHASNSDPAKFLWDRIQANAIPVSIGPTAGAEGDRIFFLEAGFASYTPQQGSVDDVHIYSLEGYAADDLVRGIIGISANAAKTASGKGSLYNLGQVGAEQRLFAALHVLDLQGSSPQLDAVVKSDTDTNFGDADETSRLTFAQATAPTSEILSVGGAIADTHYGVDFTLGSNTTSATFLVAIGIV